MRHGYCGVALAIGKPRDRGDGKPGDQLTNKNDASSLSAPNIESQVHFFERLVKWNGAAKDPRHVEFETDQADIGFTGKLIQLRPNWHKFLQQRGIDGVVQHEQVLPFSGEKRALLSDCHSIIKTVEEVLELQTIIGVQT